MTMHDFSKQHADLAALEKQTRQRRWKRLRAEAEALLARTKRFDPDQPRDPDGKWTSGGGTEDSGGGSADTSSDKPGKGEHPGEGYSKHAYVDKHGVIQTTKVEDAARALSENRKVNLDQPKKVSVLLDHLGQVAKTMEKMGVKAPTFNLCNVTVTGTNLFCVESKGIPRVQMPQLDEQQTKDFVKYLEKQGYKISKEKELASHMRATQNELNGAKVAGNMKRLRKEGDENLPRMIISRDDYVLDGHHRWAAKIGLDAADNKLSNDLKMKVSRVDIPITKLLEEAEKFTGGKGKKPATESKAASVV